VQVKHNPFPAVTVHGLAQAIAALAAGRPVTLLSGPGAACYAGCGWWRALVEHALARHPETPADDILDCADAAGRAFEALRIGQKALVLLPQCSAYAAVAAAAVECGAVLLAERPASLDLALRGASRRLPEWLGANPALP
jgi:hypothetical protein